MTTNTIKVKCANCDGITEIEGRYDVGMDDTTECSHCNFIASKYNFDFVSGVGAKQFTKKRK